MRQVGDSIVHSANAGDHSLGLAASSVDRNYGGKSCPPQPPNWIGTEGSVLPHTGAHTRLCEFQYDGRDAANEKRQRVLEHTPRYYVGRHKRGLASRPQEIRGKLVARSNSARVAASKPLRTGQGRTIGVVTVAKLFICFARVSLRVHLRAIAAKSQVSETPAAFRRP
jgi:hypothetical protein